MEPADNRYALVAVAVHHPALVGAEQPLSAWKDHVQARCDLTPEFLTHRAVCAPSQDEFAFVAGPTTLPRDEIEREIARLAPWTYHLETHGASTRRHGTYNEGTIAFHRHRANLIARTVRDLLGEETATSTILDIGCNSGFFTLDLAARGVSRAVGVDLRPENIAQAEFLKRLYGLDTVEFRRDNIKNIVGGAEAYDVILNLGLMYHLSTPFEVMRMCFESTRKFCVVDSITHTEPFSGYHLLIKDTAVSIEGDLSFELQPTYRGILDTMMAAGFLYIVEIVADVADIALYADGSRRCLIGFKADPSPYLERLRTCRA